MERHLPQSVLVFDRFHVIKLVNDKIDQVRREVQRQAEHRGYKQIKGVRYLLLTGSERLDEDKRGRLQEAIKLNEPLSTAYHLKEEIRQFCACCSANQGAGGLQHCILKALASGVQALKAWASPYSGTPGRSSTTSRPRSPAA